MLTLAFRCIVLSSFGVDESFVWGPDVGLIEGFRTLLVAVYVSLRLAECASLCVGVCPFVSWIRRILLHMNK